MKSETQHAVHPTATEGDPTVGCGCAFGVKRASGQVFVRMCLFSTPVDYLTVARLNSPKTPFQIQCGGLQLFLLSYCCEASVSTAALQAPATFMVHHKEGIPISGRARKRNWMATATRRQLPQDAHTDIQVNMTKGDRAALKVPSHGSCRRRPL